MGNSFESDPTLDKKKIEETAKTEVGPVENLDLLTVEDLALLGLSPYSTIDEIIQKLKERGHLM